MPQGGIVTTYSDITDRVEAAEALARANETLERRVQRAHRRADRGEQGAGRSPSARPTRPTSTRPASWRRPATTCCSRSTPRASTPPAWSSAHIADPEAKLARNIDASLEAVEEILNVLIEISRLDAGGFEPDITVFPLQRAAASAWRWSSSRWRARRGSICASCPPALWVRVGPPAAAPPAAEPGVQRHQVHGERAGAAGRAAPRRQAAASRCTIPAPASPGRKRTLIFKEFQRLEETAQSVRGLGLGLAIVERIGKVLDHRHRAAIDAGQRLAVRRRPAARRAAADREPRASPRRPPVGRLAGLRVLCIDNEPDVLNALCVLLEGWGCTSSPPSTAPRRCRACAEAGGSRTSCWPTITSTGPPASRPLRRCAPRSRAVQTPPVIVITADHSAEVQRAVRARGYALLRNLGVNLFPLGVGLGQNAVVMKVDDAILEPCLGKNHQRLRATQPNRPGRCDCRRHIGDAALEFAGLIRSTVGKRRCQAAKINDVATPAKT